MDEIVLRTFGQLSYKNPRDILVELRSFELELAGSDTPSKIKSLRTNSLNLYRQMREAALFCHFMSERIGYNVYFSLSEDQDYDFIATWDIDNTRHYAPVQLKEVVPKNTNSSATLEDVLNSLNKYVDSKNLIVAVHLNQEYHYDPQKLILPNLTIAELWVFGATSQDQTCWCLWGNLLQDSIHTPHQYPVTKLPISQVTPYYPSF